MMPKSSRGNGDTGRFAWGRKKGSCTSTEAQFYWSFMINGIEYSLYDNVLLFEEDDTLPHVGKLIKIWESANRQKKVKILWFFRPMEIKEHLRGDVPLANELFLASGESTDITNVNDLEAVAGKCNVVCISEDRRNRQPSDDERGKADYLFYRTFDVRRSRICNKIDDQIAGVKVELLLNKKPGHSAHIEAPSKDMHPSVRDIPVVSSYLSPSMKKAFSDTLKPRNDHQTFKARLDRMCSSNMEVEASGSGNLSMGLLKIKKSKAPFHLGIQSPASVSCGKEAGSSHAMNPARKMESKPIERKMNENVQSKWFADRPWNVKMEKAWSEGRLVLLDNLHTDFTAAEVEEIIHIVFKQNCTVRLIEQSALSNPNYGQALLIFKSVDAANNVVQRLCTEANMLLINGRPLFASKGLTRPPGRTSSALIGHLSIEKFAKLKKHEEQRNVASSSHYSQPNTIEFEMAMEWMLWDKKVTWYWQTLHQENELEIKGISASCMEF